MAKVNFVKAARKDNTAVKKGESYYWWQLYRGAKQFSITRPRPSQLTGSTFLSQAYSISEQVEDFRFDSGDDWQDDATTLIEDLINQVQELADMAQESLDNMPEGLQQGDTGMMLEERVCICEDWISDLEQADPTTFETSEEWMEATQEHADYQGE
jgi:hypothetical protein